MKVLAGDTKSLLAKVKKRIENRISVIKNQATEERDTKLKRTKDQAKQARNIILKNAKIKAREEARKIIRIAEREANELLVESKGNMEMELKNSIRDELTDFIAGKTKISGISYNQLVNDLIKKSKRAGFEFEKVKTKQGVILKTDNSQLDLTLEPLMDKIRLEELK